MAGRRRLMFAKDFTVNYLRFTALESGTFTLTIGSSVPTSNISYIEYSTDEGETWVKTDNVASTTVTITTPTIATGDSVLWRGSGLRTGSSDTSVTKSYISAFSSTCSCNVSGEIGTLLGLDKPKEVVANTHIYKGLFADMTTLVDASDLILPTVLGTYCFYYMFKGCSALVAAPELPATSLTSHCYAHMFNSCTSLTKAPILPATYLSSNSYIYMFYGCSSLNFINTSCKVDNSATTNWVYGVAATGTFIHNPIKTWAIGDSGIPTGWVAQLDRSMITEFNPQNTFTPAGCLTFSFPNGIYLGLRIKNVNSTIYISKDGANWHSLTTSDCLDLTDVDKCYVCGNLTANQTSTSHTIFYINGNFSVSGNCNALWDYSNLNASLRSYCGAYLFEGCVGLTSVSGFTLPSTTLSTGCYRGMFNNCSSLVDAPSLPSPNMIDSCYSEMFRNCSSLTSAPTLASTSLAAYCYSNMFYGCSSLTTAPNLPATTTANNCYYSMFGDCTSLINPPIISATTTRTYCFAYMFNGCTNLTSPPFIPLADFSLYSYSFQGMFYGCTSLTSACCINFANVESTDDSTFANMFYGCTALTTVPDAIGSASTYISIRACQRMFRGCTSLTTAPKLKASNINSSYSYEEMFYGCSNLNSISALFTTDITSTTSYTNNWVYGVAATGTFKMNPLASWSRTGTSGIPTGWNVEIDTDVITEYNPQETFTPEGYLTFAFSSLSYLGFATKSDDSHLIYMSKNGTNWQEMHKGDVFRFSTNDSCYICGNLISSISNSDYFTNFIIVGGCSVSGNCNSLLNYSNLTANLIYPAFQNLFKGCNGLISASGLTLPATTLISSCYQSMFYNCTSLVNPPTIGATSTTSYCFHSMFYGCTSLTTTPTISLTDYNIQERSFYYMFYGCTSLTSTSCIDFGNITSCRTYALYGMFYGCTALTTTPSVIGNVNTSLGISCFAYMFYGCTNITTVPELPRAVIGSNGTGCYQYMFYQCSKITTAPELPADTLYSGCYNYMFRYCTKLNYVKALFTTTPSSSYTNYWLGSTSSTGIFVKNINATWTTTGNHGVPSSWTILYFDPDTEKYYLDDKTTECDDHGNPL